MGRSVIGQENGAIKSVQTLLTGTTASSGTVLVNFTINSVNTSKTEVYSAGWSEHDCARQLTSSTNLQVGFRRGDINHYWRKSFSIVQYY